MRIIDWKEFSLLPNGTVFSCLEYADESIHIKGETLYYNDDDPNDPSDFSEIVLMPIYYEKEEKWSLIDGRYGFVDPDTKFLVYDHDMLDLIIDLLRKAKDTAEKKK